MKTKETSIFEVNEQVIYLGKEELTVVNTNGCIIGGVIHIPCADKNNVIDDYSINFLEKKEKVFNEKVLRQEIINTWGEHGAHCEIYDSILRVYNLHNDFIDKRENSNSNTNSKPNQKQFKQFDSNLAKAYLNKFDDNAKKHFCLEVFSMLSKNDLGFIKNCLTEIISEIR